MFKPVILVFVYFRHFQKVLKVKGRLESYFVFVSVEIDVQLRPIVSTVVTAHQPREHDMCQQWGQVKRYTILTIFYFFHSVMALIRISILSILLG